MSSKRVASDYLTKDGGPESVAGNSEKPNMATSAQLAARKIAQPKRRLGATSSNKTPSFGSVPNPFGGISNGTPQQQATFGGINGVTFGSQSQSFAPNNSAPSGGFNFQAPSTISFGDSAQLQPSNPFANMNADSNGVQDSTNNEDAMMESPQKKPNFGFSFGANNNNNPPSTNSGFSFGQTQPNGGFGFGSAQPSSALGSSTSIFGNTTNPESSSQPGGLFGGFTRAQEPGSTAQAPASTFLFGQSQPGQSSSNSTFGSSQPQSAASAQSSSFPPFGQPSMSQSQTGLFNADKSEAQSSSFTFGQTQPSSQPGSTLFNGFGSSKAEETIKPIFSIGQPTTSAEPASNIFGQPAPQPMSTSKTFAQSSSAPKIPDGSQEAGTGQPANPFAGLFGSGQTPTPSQTATDSTPATAKPVFSFGSPAQTSGNLFGPRATQGPQTTSDVQPAEISTAEQVFATPRIDSSAQQTSATPANGNGFNSGFATAVGSSNSLFGAPKSSESSGSKTADLFSQMSRQDPVDQSQISQQQPKLNEPKSDNTALFSSGFGVDQSKQNESMVKDSSWGGGDLFGKKPQTPDVQHSLTKAIPASSSNGDLFRQSFDESPKAQTQISEGEKAPGGEAAPFASQAAFGFTPKPPAQFGISNPSSNNSSLFKETPDKLITTTPRSNSIPSEQGVAAPPQPMSQSNVSALEPVKIRPRTNGPAYVPGSFDNDQRAELDKAYRLVSLDHGLSRQIAALDFRHRDLANTVRAYVAARESIGQAIGGLLRATAGSKRKADGNAGSDEDAAAQSKKAKADHVNSRGNSFQNAPNSAPSVSEPPSNTSSLFKSMISSTPSTEKTVMNAAPASAPPKSVFTSMKPASSFGAAPSVPQASSGSLFTSSSNALPPFGKPLQSADGSAPSSSAGFKPSMPSTTPTKSPPKKLAFEVPKFGAASSNDFMKSFAQSAQKSVQKEKQKRKLEEFDSDEETEEEYDARQKRIDEENKARLSGIGQTGFKPSIGKPESATPIKSLSSPQKKTAKAPPSTESSEAEESQSQEDDQNDEEGDDGNYEPGNSQDSEESEDSEEAGESEGHFADDDAEDSGEDLQDAFQESRQNKSKSSSLFDRITRPDQHNLGKEHINGTTSEPHTSKGPSQNTFDDKVSSSEDQPILQSAPNKSFKGFPIGSNLFQSTPTAPAVSPFSPINSLESAKQSFEPAKTFNFTPTPPTGTSTPVPGASVLFGGTTKDGFIPGEGLFGSRPSTPNNGQSTTAPSNIFGNLTKPSNNSSPTGDRLWKRGDPINFGTPEKAGSGPAFNITAATPPAKDDENTSKPFQNLFGGNPPSGAASSSTPGGPLGFSFGTPAPGFLGAASHLLPSANSSVVSSRATSPGGTDNESVTTDTEDVPNDPQTSLMHSRPGEEDEDVLYEARSKALKFFDTKMASGKPGVKENDYHTMGLGEVRVLKNRGTGKSRILFRAEPSSNIVINTNLVPSIEYVSPPGGKGGSVKFGIFTKDGVESWALKTKTHEMADQLAAILEDHKNA